MSERKNPILLGEVIHVLMHDVDESNPEAVFQYANRHATGSDELEVLEVKDGVVFAVTDVELHTNGDTDSQCTSTTVPYAEIPELIKALTKIMDSE
ncbi:MAG: hypothetical protein ACTH7L_01680 [Psychrobacter alimentarius]